MTAIDANPNTTWANYQLMGHGEPTPNPGWNEYSWIDTDAITKLAAMTGVKTNPLLEPSPAVEAFPNPYSSTLDAPATRNDYGINNTFPFLVPATFTSIPHGVVDRIGQGLFPGNLDSFRIGDFDGDQETELLFGNYDGFVHAMVFDEASGIPLLKDEWRSAPLGWGIAAMDVGPLIGPGEWVVAGDSTGRLWKIKIGVDSSGLAFPFTMGVPHRFLAYLRLGQFRSGSNDVVVQDEFHQFHLYAASGAHQASTTRFQFDPTTHQPNDDYIGMTGLPTMADVDTDPEKELLVPCMDGFLRKVEFTGSSASVHTYVNTDPLKVFHLKATLHCCLPYDPDQNPSNGFYVIVGGVGHTDYTQPDDEVIGKPAPFLATYEIDANDNAEVIDILTDPDIKNHPVVMEWIDENQNTFALASGNVIAKFDADDFVGLGASPPAPIASIEVPGLPDPPDLSLAPSGLPIGEVTVTSMEVHDGYVIAGTPAGRIFILDSDLNATRNTSHVDLPLDRRALPYQANLSLGWTFGVDRQPQISDPPLPENLHYLESAVPYYSYEGVSEEYIGVGQINPRTGEIDHFYDDLGKDRLFDTLAGWRDLDIRMTGSPTTIEHVITREVADIRESTGWIYYNFETGNLSSATGGYVFRKPLPEGTANFSLMHNFKVPILPGYAAIKEGDGGKAQGQYTTQNGPSYGLYHGNSLQVADLPVGTGSSPRSTKELVVVGTLGGMVYAVDPDFPDQEPDDQNSALVYDLRKDLGWGAQGLDVGDVDGDGENEVVVGIWVDDATEAERDPKSHIGNLVILDCDGTTGEFVIQHEITLEDPQQGGPGVFATGILGVKIDDTDGDGTFEIWCGDAAGHFYCLDFDSSVGEWKAFYRSESLGPYPGVYNNIHPVKDETTGKTTHLVVVTPGYIYRFTLQGSSPW